MNENKKLPLDNETDFFIIAQMRNTIKAKMVKHIRTRKNHSQIPCYPTVFTDELRSRNYARFGARSPSLTQGSISDKYARVEPNSFYSLASNQFTFILGIKEVIQTRTINSARPQDNMKNGLFETGSIPGLLNINRIT